MNTFCATEKFYLIIPAYEPDIKLVILLENIKERANIHENREDIIDYTIILIDDGSSRACEEVFAKASVYGTVLKHEKNMGKGAALRTAFTYIKELGEAGVMVTADADGQHLPEDIDRVARAVTKHTDALVTGIRAFVGDVPLRSRIGNGITRKVFALTSGVDVSDTQCGLRGIHTNYLDFLLSLEGNRYEYEMHMLTEAAKIMKIQEVPIETIYLEENASSHFHVLRDSYLIYKDLVGFALASFASFIIDYIAYVLFFMLWAGVGMVNQLLFANICARVVSASFNYTINKKMVFKDKNHISSSLCRYILLATVILCINSALLFILYILGMGNAYILKLFVELFLFISSWLIQKRFIFNRRERVYAR